MNLHTTGRYLMKDGVKMHKENRPYSREELEGVKCMGDKILLVDRETREKMVFGRGREIHFAPKVDITNMTKSELKLLMPDTEFPTKITKAELQYEWRKRNG